MVVDKLEMVETRNRNLEGLLAESEKREELRSDREAEMQDRISQLESRLGRCERAAQMHQTGLFDGDSVVVSSEQKLAMQKKWSAWTKETLDEDSQPEESTLMDAGGLFQCCSAILSLYCASI